MKKMWWSAGACLILIVLIMIIMYAFRHEPDQEANEYGNAGAFSSGERDFYDQDVGPGAAPIRPLYPRGETPAPNMGVTVQPYGSQPVGRGFVLDEGAVPDPRVHEGARMDEGRPPQAEEPEEYARDGDFYGQPPDEEPYEDGNPGEEPPPDGIDE
jgi:hypothetical protein